MIKTEIHDAWYIQSSKEPDQMYETTFLQMSSFSIIVTSLHSFNLSFPLILHVISTAIPKFPP